MPPRALARTCGALFAVSSAFPVIAGALNRRQPLGWLGALDVALAAALVGGAAGLVPRARPLVTDAHRLAAWRVTRGVVSAIPALLAAYFLAGARVNWAVLVIGLAWRGWLLIAVLPYLVAGLAAAPRIAARGGTPPRVRAGRA